jgi:quinoprotein glucose dehydrogenase
MLRFAMARAVAKTVSAFKEKPAVLPLTEDGSLIILLAERLAGDADVKYYLDAAEPRLSLEAAKAIHDEPIPAALPTLADLLDRAVPFTAKLPEDAATSVLRRAVNAAYRLGTPKSAMLLAGAAATPELPKAARLDALEALTQWTATLGRDRLLGIVIPGDGPRDRASAAAALTTTLGKLRTDADADLRIAALEAAAAHKVQIGAFIADVSDPNQPGAVRAAVLYALNKSGEAPEFPSILQKALVDKDPVVAEAARRIEANRSPAKALAQAATTLKSGTMAEKQQAIETLGLLEPKGADDQLLVLLAEMKSGKVPLALHLDVLEASARRSGPAVQAKLKDWEKARAKNDPLAVWRECLEGGNAQAGRQIFAEKAEAACMRCHAVAKRGGDVGPDLVGMGSKHDRAYLLRAIVDPNVEIAPSYENVLVTLTDGNVLAGIAASEDAETIVIKNVADGKTQAVKKSAIKERQKLPSAMPPGLGEVLGKRGLRDLVEYLATLK